MHYHHGIIWNHPEIVAERKNTRKGAQGSVRGKFGVPRDWLKCTSNRL
jgi:hypothetical protein